MSATPTVLVVEDAPDIRLALRALLTRAGLRAVEAPDARNGLRSLYTERPDLVVLDIGLPDMDGWEVLARIRELDDVPVLILTARGLEMEKVRGLRAGADDYLTKPYGNQELLARVEALLRRTRRRGGVAAPEQVFDDGWLRLDHESRTAAVAGVRLDLTPTEFRLISALARRPGIVFSPDQLVEAAWGDNSGGSGERVKYAVLRLRRKVAAAAPTAGDPIETLRGFGYRYRKPPQD